MMEEQDVRVRAEALCAAVVAGDIESATVDFSDELRRHMGDVLAMLPLPSTEAVVESVERGGGSGFTVVLRLVGETEEVLIQTRWKERGGQPTIIEASHLSRIESAAHDGAPSGAADDTGHAG
jgi:hypothetical protein